MRLLGSGSPEPTTKNLAVKVTTFSIFISQIRTWTSNLYVIQSYIDVNDFPTVSALADYLIYLTENPVSGKSLNFKSYLVIVNVFSHKVEYLKYFDWKKEYKYFHQNPYCTICQKLHNKKEPVNIYPNITKWYYEDNEGKKQCTDGSEREYYKSFMTEMTNSQSMVSRNITKSLK